MQDLLILKKALEKPGIGKYRHDIAEQFRNTKHVPRRWIRAWINTEWHTMGCKYLWLAAMNASIGRHDVPISIIYQGLCKPDPSTFNAAIEACSKRKIPFAIISWWYNSDRIILQLAAINACLNNPDVPVRFVKRASNHSDIRIRKIAKQILG